MRKSQKRGYAYVKTKANRRGYPKEYAKEKNIRLIQGKRVVVRKK